MKHVDNCFKLHITPRSFCLLFIAAVADADTIGLLWSCLFVLSSFFFFFFLSFPRLISTVAESMSTILLHMVYVALVRIWDACLKRAARGSLEMQDPKIAKIRYLHGHHRTILLGYIFATKACIDNRKIYYC